MNLSLFTSPKTTIAAISGLVSALAYVVYMFFDGDPATMPDFTAVLAVVIPSIGLLFARDNNVTSEQAGAGK